MNNIIKVFALLGLLMTTSMGIYYKGYYDSKQFYNERVAKTERLLKDVLKNSSKTLQDLSETIANGDAKDLTRLEEIINNAPEHISGDCRIQLDSVFKLDDIGP